MSEFYYFTTPLHDAVRINNIEEVKKKLENINKDDLIIEDEDNMTPLELAEYLEYTDITKLLKDKLGCIDKL